MKPRDALALTHTRIDNSDVELGLSFSASLLFAELLHSASHSASSEITLGDFSLQASHFIISGFGPVTYIFPEKPVISEIPQRNQSSSQVTNRPSAPQFRHLMLYREYSLPMRSLRSFVAKSHHSRSYWVAFSGLSNLVGLFADEPCPGDMKRPPPRRSQIPRTAMLELVFRA